MAFRALVAAFFLIFVSLPSGACCAPRAVETTAGDHSAHHGAPEDPKSAKHSVAAFVCVSFCAATPASATVIAPGVASAIEIERTASLLPESADVGPAPRPPRAS